MVGVQGAEEHADLSLGVAHARLEGLRDLVQQQVPPRLPGRQGLDPAVAGERPQPKPRAIASMTAAGSSAAGRQL